MNSVPVITIDGPSGSGKYTLIKCIKCLEPFNSGELIVDDMLEQNQRNKLSEFLNKFLKNKVNTVLERLIDLKNLKDKNSSIVYSTNPDFDKYQTQELIMDPDGNNYLLINLIRKVFKTYFIESTSRPTMTKKSVCDSCLFLKKINLRIPNFMIQTYSMNKYNWCCIVYFMNLKVRSFVVQAFTH